MSGLGIGIYLIIVFLMMTGMYVVVSRGNLVKKLVGLNLFQTSVFFLYICIGYVEDASVPILTEGVERYSNPLTSVLILTAIVVGVATTALGLALVVRIRQAFGTVEEDEIHRMDPSL